MDGEQPAAHRHWLTGFDQRRGAQVDVAEAGENADSRDDCRAQKAYITKIFKCVRRSALYIE
jgi:hypothetical protein